MRTVCPLRLQTPTHRFKQVFNEKKSAYEWTYAVQTFVVQGLAVYEKLLSIPRPPKNNLQNHTKYA